MPRIPTRDALTQATPRPQGGIVQAPRDFVGAGMEALGKDIYVAAEKERKQQSALELAKARSEWNTSILKLDADFEMDKNPDHGTWGKKYETLAKVYQKRAASGISDPQIQQQFLYETDDDKVRVGIGVQKRAQTIARSERLTNAELAIEQMIDNAASSDDETAQRIFGDMRATIQDMVDTGAITEAQAGKTSLEAGRRYAALKVQRDIDQDPAAAFSHISGRAGDSYFSRLARKESSGRDNAKASTSSATGRYQFIDETWEELRTKYPELNLTEDGRTDRAQSERAIRKFTELNAQRLSKAGIAPTEANLYLAHFMGAGGAIEMLKADPNAVAAQAFPKAAEANPTIFYDKAGRPRSVQEVIAVQTKGFAGGGQAPRYYGMLSAEQRIQFGRAAEAESKRRETVADASFALRKNELAGLIASDVESVAATGQGVEIDGDEVLDLLGPVKYTEWQKAREIATQYQETVEPFNSLTSQDIIDRTNALKPEAGDPEFEDKSKLYAQVEKRARETLKLRSDDPALAADMMLPENQRLAQQFNPSQPETLAPIIARRMAAQETLGVSQANRMPLTDGESSAIADAIKVMAPEEKAAYVGKLAQASGKQLPFVLAQIGMKEPEEASLATFAAIGLQRTAIDGWRGMQAIKEGAVERLKGEAASSADGVDLEFTRGLYDSSTASARVAAVNAARNIYAARALDRGITEFDEALYEQALADAHGAYGGTGGVSEYNGGRFVLPTKVNEDTFLLAIDNLQPEDLTALSASGGAPHHISLSGEWSEATLDDVKGGYLVAVGNGRYKISMTDPSGDLAKTPPQYLIDRSTGNAWIMQFEDVDSIASRRPARSMMDRLLEGVGIR